ncbi:MAG: hypothetical protein ACREN5_09610 [Gemmatimonadales bacterium]
MSSSGAEANNAGTFGAFFGSISSGANAGRYVAFVADSTNLVSDDTNGFPDIFRRDRSTGTTTRVNIGPGGVQSDGGSDKPRISGDGRYVVFYSEASNLVLGDTNGYQDVFVRDLGQ